jgi:hypothetical protein
MKFYEESVGKGEFDVLESMNAATLEAILGEFLGLYLVNEIFKRSLIFKESMLGVKEDYINTKNHPYLETCEK